MTDERVDVAKYAIRCALRASALVKEALNTQKDEERQKITTELAVDKIGRLNAAASNELKESLAAIAEYDKMILSGKKLRNGRRKRKNTLDV